MGGSSWSDEFYEERARERAERREETFAYTAHVSRAPAHERVVHPTLSPKRPDGTPVVRESRDSEAHPQSLAIIVGLDVTGSMRESPAICQKNLPRLMGLLIEKGYVADPQVLPLAIGDAHCDSFPFQVGQFESGVEIEDHLRNMVLEGGGGAGSTESYELALHFAARHTSIDCFEKRGEKGFLFIVGDGFALETPRSIDFSGN